MQLSSSCWEESQPARHPVSIAYLTPTICSPILPSSLTHTDQSHTSGHGLQAVVVKASFLFVAGFINAKTQKKVTGGNHIRGEIGLKPYRINTAPSPVRWHVTILSWQFSLLNLHWGVSSSSADHATLYNSTFTLKFLHLSHKHNNIKVKHPSLMKEKKKKNHKLLQKLSRDLMRFLSNLNQFSWEIKDFWKGRISYI